MTQPQIERVLSEYNELVLTNDDPELRAVQTAILVEDACGVVLTDEQISAAVLGDAARLRDLLVHSTSTT